MSPTSFWLDKLREDWTRDERERAERSVLTWATAPQGE